MELKVNQIKPPKTIGILGGGQLGRMMAIAAKEMGFRVAVLEPNQDSPCGQIADKEVLSPYDSSEGIEQLAKHSDVITYEFENVDAQSAKTLEKQSNVPQGSELLEITQNRTKEKDMLQTVGVKVAPYMVVDGQVQLKKAIDKIGYPAVLKTSTGGYDGKGQVVLRSETDFDKAEQLLSSDLQCVLEKWIDFEKEISVIVARNADGEIQTFPVAENLHKENILFETIVPARITEEITEEARKVAIHLAHQLNLIGTLAVEMFLTNEGTLYVNELAPRPHNSGHYTIEACETSQFQQHIRAICNWRLGKTTLLKPAVMVNLLGRDAEHILEIAPNDPEIHLHLYGKSEIKDKRKMGHFTILSNTIEEALAKADDILQKMKEKAEDMGVSK
jgi:5-(carboxyamino)imidazole ribonucleotide synthase